MKTETDAKWNDQITPAYFFKVLVLIFVFLAVTIYSAALFPVFQWRNPKANSMTFFTEFRSVLKLEKMEKYQ